MQCWSSKPIKINIKSNCSRLLLDLNYLFKLQERCTQYNSERYKRKYSTAGDTAKINEPLKKKCACVGSGNKIRVGFLPSILSHTLQTQPHPTHTHQHKACMRARIAPAHINDNYYYSVRASFSLIKLIPQKQLHLHCRYLL